MKVKKQTRSSFKTSLILLILATALSGCKMIYSERLIGKYPGATGKADADQIKNSSNEKKLQAAGARADQSLEQLFAGADVADADYRSLNEQKFNFLYKVRHFTDMSLDQAADQSADDVKPAYQELREKLLADLHNCGISRLKPACAFSDKGYFISNYDYTQQFDSEDKKDMIVRHQFDLEDSKSVHITLFDLKPYRTNADGTRSLIPVEPKQVTKADIPAVEKKRISAIKNRKERKKQAALTVAKVRRHLQSKQKKYRKVRFIFAYEFNLDDKKETHFRLHVIPRPRNLRKIRQIEEHYAAVLKRKILTVNIPYQRFKHLKEQLQAEDKDQPNHRRAYYISQFILQTKEKLGLMSKAEWKKLLLPVIGRKVVEAIEAKDETYQMHYLTLLSEENNGHKEYASTLAKSLLRSGKTKFRAYAAVSLVTMGLANQRVTNLAIELIGKLDSDKMKVALLEKLTQVTDLRDDQVARLIDLLNNESGPVREAVAALVERMRADSRRSNRGMADIAFADGKFLRSKDLDLKLAEAKADAAKKNVVADKSHSGEASPERLNAEQQEAADERTGEEQEDLQAYLARLQSADNYEQTEAIARHRNWPQAVVTDTMVKLLGDGDSAVVDAAKSALVDRGLIDKHAAELEKYLKQNKDMLAFKAAIQLVPLVKSDKLTPLLIDLVVHQDADVALLAADAIENLPALGDSYVTNIKSAWTKGEVNGKLALIKILSSIEGAAATTAMLDVLKEHERSLGQAVMDVVENRITVDVYDKVAALLAYADNADTRNNAFDLIKLYQGTDRENDMRQAIQNRASAETDAELKAEMQGFLGLNTGP